MSKKLKGVIFSIDDVLSSKRNWNEEIFSEIILLLKFIMSKGLQPVVLANRNQTYGGEDAEEIITERVGVFPWFMAIRDHLPKKPTAQAIGHVLNEMNWDTTEAMYVGNKDDDMRTAVNGGILFLNACWYGKKTEYGIQFQNPLDVGRFIDIFCLRESLWHYQIKDESLEYYSLGTFSTYKPEFAVYSQDAKDSAKFGAGHPDFWTKYLWSTIYFSEIYKEVKFVAPYPGHKASNVSVSSNLLEEPMLAFTKCFRISYLRDLIIRHTTAKKSQSARNTGVNIGHENQLQTININRNPLKGSGKGTYKKNPIKGATVLVIDDICTQAFSLETARVYLEKAGANVICLSWLKTINTDYRKIKTLNKPDFDPYAPNKGLLIINDKSFPYRSCITDRSSTEELDSKLAAYRDWTWPMTL